jgi:hypothetical protein
VFNPTKCILIFFGIREHEEIFIVWNGKRIIADSKAKHLGHSRDQVIDEVIGEMYKRTNRIQSIFSFCDYEIKYRLFQTYVMSLYGSALGILPITRSTDC